ncbi:molecular chaperone GrpE [Elusimicrobium posterum]|uniref:nucleotide exchange factor GrpE n=1 Tax=Elusimicrobium posterum TaxID=3116653 RepID=UPI003C73CED4
MKKHEEIEEQPEQEAQQSEKPAQQDYYEQLIRLKADFENYRKRTEREKAELISYGSAQTVAQFLPLYDAMLKAKEQLKKHKEGDAKSLKEGLDMVFKEMTKVFENAGVKPMEVMGKPYDPMQQEVLTTLPCAPEKDNCVVEEVQKGFTLNGKILRCAKVCVGKAEESAEEQQQDKKENQEG